MDTGVEHSRPTRAVVFFNASARTVYVTIESRQYVCKAHANGSSKAVIVGSKKYGQTGVKISNNTSSKYDWSEVIKRGAFAVTAQSCKAIHHHGIAFISVSYRKDGNHPVVTGYETDLPRFYFEDESNYGTRGRVIRYGEKFYLYHQKTGRCLTLAGTSDCQRGFVGAVSDSLKFSPDGAGKKKIGEKVETGDFFTLEARDDLSACVRVKVNRKNKVLFVGKHPSSNLWRIGKETDDGDRYIYEGELVSLTNGKSGYLSKCCDSSKLECASAEDFWVILRCENSQKQDHKIGGCATFTPLSLMEKADVVTPLFSSYGHYGYDCHCHTTDCAVNVFQASIRGAEIPSSSAEGGYENIPADPQLQPETAAPASESTSTMDSDPPTYESLSIVPQHTSGQCTVATTLSGDEIRMTLIDEPSEWILVSVFKPKQSL